MPLTKAGMNSSEIELVQNGAFTSGSRGRAARVDRFVAVAHDAQAEQLLAERLAGVLALAQHQRDGHGGDGDRDAGHRLLEVLERGELAHAVEAERGVGVERTLEVRSPAADMLV